MKQLIYPITFLLIISIASAITVQQLVDSYDYDYTNGSINITQYTNGMLDTNGDGLSDTLLFNLTAVPNVTGNYKTLVILSNDNGVWAGNTSKTITTTDIVQVNFSTLNLNGSGWNYTVRIFDSNNVAVFEDSGQQTGTFGNYKNGTSIKSIQDAVVNNDYINLTLVLNVSKTEAVNITAFLKYNNTNNANITKNATISAKTEISLTADQEKTVNIIFDNETIKSTHYNGAYILETVSIGERSLKTNYKTASYDYEDLAKTSYFKVYNHSFIDSNGNGLYEFLNLNVMLNVKQGGTYAISGALYDLFDNEVINFSDTQLLSQGVQNWNISINGSQIYQSYVDGPYVIKYMTLKDNAGNVIDSVIEPYITNSTSISDYELPKLPDLRTTILVSTDKTIAETNVTINVTNVGSAPAVGISVDLLDNTSIIRKNESIGSLAANEWQAFNYTLSNMNSTNISYVAIVDLFDSIDELDEDNNVEVWPPTGNTPPTHDTPILNSTYGTNLTTENLTVYNISTYDLDGDNVTNIISWYRNNTPFTVFNAPFEGGSNSTFTREYSGFQNNGTVIGADWNATGGFDGKGAYTFNGTNATFIVFTNSSNITTGIDSEFTVVAWVYPNTTGTTIPMCILCFLNGVNYQIRVQPNVQNRLQFVLVNGTGQQEILQNNTIFVNRSVWNFVSVRYKKEGSTVRIGVGTKFLNISRTSNISFSQTNMTLGSTITGSGNNFNGSIDDVMIFNNSLTDEQIQLIYENRTDIIHESLTDVGDIWNASMTPNDGSEDGTTKYSNNLTIFPNRPPTQGTPILNSTYGTNLTAENLTIYNVSTSDADGDNVTNIINWYRNNTPYTVLNMPFEGGTNGTFVKDYSGNQYNGTGQNLVYQNTAGQDGFGIINLTTDGTTIRYLNLTNNGLSPAFANEPFSIEAWFQTVGCNNAGNIITKCASSANQLCNYRILIRCANGTIEFYTGDGTNFRVANANTNYINTGWHHLVAVYNKKEQRQYLYVDNMLKDNISNTLTNLS